MYIFRNSFFNLHSTPGDYAWGRGGIDDIISQVILYFFYITLMDRLLIYGAMLYLT